MIHFSKLLSYLKMHSVQNRNSPTCKVMLALCSDVLDVFLISSRKKPVKFGLFTMVLVP